MAKRVLSIILLLLFIQCIAFAQTQFTTDISAINEAAQSVLMLEVIRDGETIAAGSGFVAFSNRTLVTNQHVIEGADTVLAYSDDGYSFVLNKVVEVDEKADLAVLSFFSPTDRIPLILNTGEVLRAEPVVAIGSPKGMLNTVSMGNVSAVFEDESVGYIQFTAPISSGSSGGALFNDRGEVIGVTTSAYDDGEGIVQNLNFAVDAREVARLGAEMDEGNAILLEDYLKGVRPGQTLEPTLMPTPTPTVKPTPTLSPNPTPNPTPRISNVAVEGIEKGKFKVSWKDTVSEDSIKYYITFKEVGTTNIYTFAAPLIDHSGGSLSTVIGVDLKADVKYIVAVDLSRKASETDVSLNNLPENVFAFRPDTVLGIQYPELKQGDRGDDVRILQQALIGLGYLGGSADGVFGKQTAQAVYDFKISNSMTVYTQPYIATNLMQVILYGGKARAFTDPDFALEIPEGGYGQWEFLSGDMLKMRVQVENIARKKTIKAFELYMYATDIWGTRIYGSDRFYYATTTKKVAPGKTLYSDYMTIPNRREIDKVYVGIHKIVYADGTVKVAPYVNYFNWTIKQ